MIGLFPPSEKAVEKLYYENESELTAVCNFLLENQYPDSRIELFDSVNTIEFYTDNNAGGRNKDKSEITEKNITDSLETIVDSGFIRVLKEYNYISFQVWGSYGESVNLVFSPDSEPNISEINAKEKVVEKIKPANWFYYREKFE